MRNFFTLIHTFFFSFLLTCCLYDSECKHSPVPLHKERLSSYELLLQFYAEIALLRFFTACCWLCRTSLALVGTVNTEVSVRLHLDFPTKPFGKLNWQNASVGRELIHLKIKQNTHSKLQELHWMLGSSLKTEQVHCLCRL